MQQLDRARARLLVGHAEMDLQRFGDLQPDGQDRVERGHRLLEDHRDVAAAEIAHMLVVEIEEDAAVEDDAALRERARCGGSSRMIESADTDLPEPDSPTMARISPRPTSKLMPSTARTMPREVAKWTCKSSTVSNGAEVSACRNMV